MGASGSMFAGVGSAISAAGGAYAQSQALRAQGRLEKQSAAMNAQLDEIRARQAIQQGRFAEAGIRRGTRGLIGSQRAAMAAQGIRLTGGSAMDIVAETQAMGEMDAQTTRLNAYREAFGYKVGAAESRYRGKMAQISSKYSSRSTLVTGGMQAAGELSKGYAGWQQQKKEDEQAVQNEERMVRLFGPAWR